MQRLYQPEQGRVLVDGVDISTIDASSLRRQIGVVLQENVLFNRSIRDNIALSDPGMPLQRVMQAAQLAGAHEFIAELPEGYDTMVGEHGATLSGGQRQRIAIARALLSNPRILIFDEATSALDYESERIVQQNMREISRGRTVLIIAHRLSAVKDAHRIVVMDRGDIVEEGTHADLLQREQAVRRAVSHAAGVAMALGHARARGAIWSAGTGGVRLFLARAQVVGTHALPQRRGRVPCPPRCPCSSRRCRPRPGWRCGC